MSVTSHPITAEINKIISSQNRKVGDPIRNNYRAFIHVMDTDKTYKTFKTLYFDVNRDYENNISDEITIAVVFVPGTWSDEVFPYINNLEISVIRGKGWQMSHSTLTRYKAYAKNPKDIRKLSPHIQGLSTDTVDRMDVITLEFQLVPLLIEKLLTVQTGTNFVTATVGDSLKAMLYNEANKLEGLQDSDQLQGVDMVEPDNTQVYQNIPIPHHTKLVNLPQYMQKHGYGVYQQGMGHYIQNGVWYVYPHYRTERRDAQVRFLNIFVTHRDFLKYADFTYRTEGEDVFVLGTLEGETENLEAASLLNNGNGLRMMNPHVQNTEESLKVSDNKAIISRSNNVNEFNVVPSPNGAQHAPLKADSANQSNIYEQVARIEGRLGKLYGIVWRNSNPDLIKPGMIVRLHYLTKDGKQEIIEGILMKAHHYTHSTSPGLNSSTFDCVTGLFIYSKSIKRE